MIKVCIADDHKLFCDGLERLLIDSKKFHILYKFHNGSSLLETIHTFQPELLIVDIEMPGMNGLDIIKRVHLHDPTIKIVILSMHEESAYIQEAYLLGANAYLSKSIESELLLQSLLHVHSGERIFPPVTIFDKSSSPLSSREEEVLKLVAKGKTSEEIATKLNISHLTVKAHRRNMIRKLKVRNSSELITRAVEKGLI